MPFTAYTPLMLAIFYEHFELTKYLIENGCDINYKIHNTYNEGATALTCAKLLGEESKIKKFVDLLLKYSAI